MTTANCRCVVFRRPFDAPGIGGLQSGADVFQIGVVFVVVLIQVGDYATPVERRRDRRATRSECLVSCDRRCGVERVFYLRPGFLAGQLPRSKLIRNLAETYTREWCSQNAASVASCYEEDGSLSVNDDPPAAGRQAEPIARGGRYW